MPIFLSDIYDNGIGNLIPGQGYQLKVNEEDELLYLPINVNY